MLGPAELFSIVGSTFIVQHISRLDQWSCIGLEIFDSEGFALCRAVAAGTEFVLCGLS